MGVKVPVALGPYKKGTFTPSLWAEVDGLSNPRLRLNFHLYNLSTIVFRIECGSNGSRLSHR